MATSPASMPLAIMPGSGLPVRFVIHSHGGDGAEGTGDRRVRGDDGELHVGGGERRCGVEAEPAEQQDERAEHRHRDVVAGDAPRGAVGGELADAGADDDGAGERGSAADGVDDAGTGEVDVAGAEAHRVPDLWRASRRPRSTREQRVEDGAAEQAPDHEAAPLPPFGHRSGRDRGDGVHEGHHVEEEADERRRDRSPLSAQPPCHRNTQFPEPSSASPTGASRPNAGS